MELVESKGWMAYFSMSHSPLLDFLTQGSLIYSLVVVCGPQRGEEILFLIQYNAPIRKQRDTGGPRAYAHEYIFWIALYGIAPCKCAKAYLPSILTSHIQIKGQVVE